jgi:copper(I)-binding protein
VRGAALLLFAGDHGVTAAAPSVSAYPRAVTPAMFAAIAAGGAASSVLCRANDVKHLELVDVGVDADVSHVRAGAPGISVAHNKVFFACLVFLLVFVCCWVNTPPATTSTALFMKKHNKKQKKHL